MLAEASKILVRFANKQARDVEQGGRRALGQKARLILGLALALLPVLLVRMLRPVVLIRFANLPSDRVGLLVEKVGFYLCERELGLHKPRTLDFFYHNLSAGNRQMRAMAQRYLGVVGIARWLDYANSKLPGGQAHRVPYVMDRAFTAEWSIYEPLSRTSAPLRFTEDEELRGRQDLNDLGISDGTPFVCFIARESAYLNDAYPENDWQYHNFRDCSIANYLPAVNELASRGYPAIRMGANVKEGLNSSNPLVIDYAKQGRTDFLDVYLSAKCRFFLTSGTGIDSVATIFQRPVACANHLPLGYSHTWGPNDLFIPKKLWLRAEDRFLRYQEAIDLGAWVLNRGEKYDELGLDVIENTPEAITALAVEMDERLKGTWITTEEDEELQQRHWDLFRLNEKQMQYLPRIGAHFLRENRNLLD